MLRMLVGLVGLFVAASAWAGSWNGSFTLISSQSNDGIEYCGDFVTITSMINRSGEVQQIELSGANQSLGIFKNDLKFKWGHEGFYGYNRFGGVVNSKEATRITTTTSFGGIKPYHASHGQRLRLSDDGQTLTYKGHDTTYGAGYHFTCVYQRNN